MAAIRPDLRVGDTERESTATSLREHYAQGRLSTDELDERLDAAFSATTQGQLEQVTHDLPPIQAAPPVTPPPAVTVPGRRAGRGAARAVTGLVSLVALLIVVAVAVRGGHHVPRNIATLVIALLILRGLVFRAFGHHHHQHHPREHWDHHEAQYSSHDDSDDDRFHRSSRPGHEHHHEHHRGRSGHGYSYSYSYRQEYNQDYPGESR
jgi:Domain of unknown function (DUF1707)